MASTTRLRVSGSQTKEDGKDVKGDKYKAVTTRALLARPNLGLGVLCLLLVMKSK